MMLGLDGQGWMSEKDAGGMQRGMLGKLASGKANEADICGDLEKKMVLSSHVHLIELPRSPIPCVPTVRFWWRIRMGAFCG
jgi:hypothetical protein